MKLISVHTGSVMATFSNLSLSLWELELIKWHLTAFASVATLYIPKVKLHKRGIPQEELSCIEQECVGEKNISGDTMTTDDVLFHNIFLEMYRQFQIGGRPVIHSLLSEDAADVISVHEDGSTMVAADFYDGSTNDSVAGSFISLWRASEKSMPVSIRDIDLAFIVLYGSITKVILSIKAKAIVVELILDPCSMSWHMTNDRVTMPETIENSVLAIGGTPSAEVDSVLHSLIGEGCKTAWFRCAVADLVEQILPYGGAYMYLGKRKIRWYEFVPMAHVILNALGAERCVGFIISDGSIISIEDYIPETLHDKRQVCVGRPDIVSRIRAACIA